MRKRLSRAVLLAEAGLLLVVAKLVILGLPPALLRSVLDTTFWSGRRGKSVLESATQVRWAIERCAGTMPSVFTCFPRGLAAHVMCRRRGIGSVLYYGAFLDTAGNLHAHVWTKDGDIGVAGHSTAAKYSVLACFPQIGKSDTLMGQEDE